MRRAAPWLVVALLGSLMLGVLPSAFAALGDSAAEAIPIGADGRFYGTTAPTRSTWFRLGYTGGTTTITVSTEYEPADSTRTDLRLYTGTPGSLRQEGTSATRTDNVLSISFTDPDARDVFVEFVNEHSDRSVSFVGSVSPISAVATLAAGTQTPTPGPVANSAQEALTVGSDGVFTGTVGPHRATWYRFWYGNPGADATVSVTFAASADDTDLKLFTGADLNSLSEQGGSPTRSDDTLSRRVNLSSAQFVYFTVTNNNDATPVAYSGLVAPAFAPPTPTPAGTATPTATSTATATPTTVPVATPAPTSTPQPAPAMTRDERYFIETGYRVDRDDIWDYFRARGRVDTFGFPVSRTFSLDGCQVQVFQRLIAQVCPGRPGVALLNLLDPDIFPYTRVNFSVFPAPDEQLKASTPRVTDPNYAQAILDFVRANAPDEFGGVRVNFQQTFFSLITPEMAGTSDPGILGLLNLEVWGAPISRPQRDPTNANFIYQRFQRGIMHHDVSSGLTRGILLADYLKQIVRNSPELPPDLRDQAQADQAAGRANGRYFAQYCPGASNWICRPTALPPSDNNLTFAFERG